jgi:hypothetical protein
VKHLLPTLLTLLVLLTSADSCFGQVFGQPFGQPSQRPAVSPFVNLNRPGTNPAINYYGLVRPKLDFYSSINQLQQGVYANQQAIATGVGGQQGPFLPITGVAANFQTQNRFFMTRGGRGGPGQGYGGTGSSYGVGTALRNLQPTSNVNTGLPSLGATSGAGILPQIR